MQFPPHAPSWGSASSFPQGVMYGVRPGYPMMARAYLLATNGTNYRPEDEFEFESETDTMMFV